jgi:hypothetical protein
MAHGRHIDDLGTEALSWRDAYVILTEQPRTSAVARAAEPEAQPWGLAEALLATLVDLTRFDLWRNSDPKKRGPEPKPIPRPGVESKKATVTKIAVTGTDKTTFDAWLERRTRGG